MNPLGQYDGPGGFARARERSIQSTPPAERRMELQGTLNAGGSAQAKFLLWDTTSSTYKTQGNAITVYSYKGASGSLGDQLDFVYRPDSQRWEAIEAKASGTYRILRFSLPSALTSSTPSVANCPVIRVASGDNPGSTVTVYNEDGWESDAGSEGWAFYDNSTSHWIIFVVPCATANSSSSS